MSVDDSTRNVLVFVAALAVLEVGREMRECTPPLKELRDTDPHEHRYELQTLIDGQAQVGIIAAGAALVAWWACKDFIPAAIILIMYAVLVWYQHSVLKAPATD